MTQETEYIKATTPDGKISVEVTLRENSFEGKVTINSVVTDEFKTESEARILGWAEKQMKEAMRRNEDGLGMRRP